MADESEKLIAQLQPSDWAWMRDNWEGKREQVFTHHDHDTDIVRHIHVSNLWDGIKAGHVSVSHRMMALTDSLYELICKGQGIERDHIPNITPDSAAFDPALVVEFPNGDNIIVDGNHKIVKAYEMGLRRRPAEFVLSCDIEEYLVYPPENVSRLMVAWSHENMIHERI